MMEFRTKVDLPLHLPLLDHADKLMLWGSCFTENMGRLFEENKFVCDVNPFGVLYNPCSIACALSQVLAGKRYADADLMQARGMWHSLMHHGSFSARDKHECLAHINDRLQRAGDFIRQARWVIFTWGTAWVYEWKETGTIVGNCHKLPDACFTRRLLSVDEIVGMYASLLAEVSSVNPSVRFLFTVSPIRHAKDGMHGNQVSKSVLHLAIHQLMGQQARCHYFPSYEIMMDELRDYRFYADDMFHPSPLAIDYMWDCLGQTFFSPSAKAFMQEWQKLRKGMEHRPFDAESEEYRTFLSKILLKIVALKEKLPYLDVQNEIELCQARLKK